MMNDETTPHENVLEQPRFDYLTVKQFSQKYPAFPEGGLRHIIFHSDKNGFADCIRRVGRKILIAEKRFLNRIDQGI